MVEITPGKEPDLNEVVCLVLALHICKDAKIRDTIKELKLNLLVIIKAADMAVSEEVRKSLIKQALDLLSKEKISGQ